ncbi:MAG: hypothetical protein EP344_02225 [Bacteroidetes bacterium]|nr:MAG: hypothetical protein EP344_02225 [Bacteroidota bacterium]
MRALFSLLTVLLTIAFFVTGVVYLLSRAFGSFSLDPKSRAFKRMLQTLRSRLNTVASDLVPWDHEMLSLLSLNRIKEKAPGWFNAVSSGQFTTIYQEPVVAYVSQRVGKSHVMVVRTSKHEFIMRRKGKETEIWLDNKPFGVFVDGVLLAPGKNSHMLAKVEDKPEEDFSPLLLGNATAATLNKPDRAKSPNPRALTLLRELDMEEEQVALAVALQQLQEK